MACVLEYVIEFFHDRLARDEDSTGMHIDWAWSQWPAPTNIRKAEIVKLQSKPRISNLGDPNSFFSQHSAEPVSTYRHVA